MMRRTSSPPKPMPQEPQHTDERRAGEEASASALRRKARGLGFWVRRVGAALLIGLSVLSLSVALVIRHYEQDLPSTSELKHYRPPQVTRVLAHDGTLLGELFVERRTVVPIESIPKHLRLAVLAAEDAKFYEHTGLDYLGMLRAILVNLRHAGARQGGSTITQQVVKNVLLTSERTFARKIREAILAHRIEQELTKDEILELYLNHIYFGHGRYGVEEASRYYFAKPVRETTLAEAALLAGLPKGPSLYSPRVDALRASKRRAFVLAQMLEKGFASQVEVEPAGREPIVLAPETDALPELAPEVVAEAKRLLHELVGDDAEHGGYTITTTIIPTLEAAARQAVRKNLDEYGKRHKLVAPFAKGKRDSAPSEESPKPASHKVYQGVVLGGDDARGTIAVRVGQLEGTVPLDRVARYNPKGLPPSRFAESGKVLRMSLVSTTSAPDHETPSEDAGHDEDGAPTERGRYRLELGPESALVAVDVHTRAIVALVGSYEGTPGGLDRASFAHRQPGSTFKAFVYGYALKARSLTPASLLATNADALGGYRPDNHDPEEAGEPRRLRDALAASVNVAAAWTIEQVGAANVAAYARSLGIESKLGSDASLALGAYEVTPRELVAAYATLGAGGIYEKPYLVERIVGPDGHEVPLPPRPMARRAIEESEAYVTTSVLTSVVESGTGKRAKALGRPIAGKTGTSNASKDAWFVGFSADIACSVWTGFDDATSLGGSETGASAALPAFVDFMREAHRERPVASFKEPPGIVHVVIDPATGLRATPDEADAMDEVFLAGTEPAELPPSDAFVDGAAPSDASAPEAVQGDASVPDPRADPPPF